MKSSTLWAGIHPFQTPNTNLYEHEHHSVVTSFIISPLTYICSTSLSSRVFPNTLKFSIMKPIFKNWDKLITSNYRPISCRLLSPRSLKSLFTVGYSHNYAWKTYLLMCNMASDPTFQMQEQLNKWNSSSNE